MKTPRSTLRLFSAATFLERLAGLHGRPRLAWHQGLHITPCSAVHTLGMRYAIDVVFLDDKHRPVRLVHRLRPWRFACCAPASSVVEFPAGYLAAQPEADTFIDQLVAALSVAG